MKKQEIIAKANADYNPTWELVHILEDLGKIEKVNPMKTQRKPAVYISENQVLLNLSETEILIVIRESAVGFIVDYRLLKYDVNNNVVEGKYVPVAFRKKEN